MDSVDIIFTRSNLIGSVVIRFFTWSDWSHCAVIDGDRIIESAIGGGVRESSLEELKKSNTDWVIKRFPVKDREKFLEYARSQIGKKYDYLGALGIAFRVDSEKKNRWFCSELIAACADACGSSWFNRDIFHKITPQDLYQMNYDWVHF